MGGAFLQENMGGALLKREHGIQENMGADLLLENMGGASLKKEHSLQSLPLSTQPLKKTKSSLISSEVWQKGEISQLDNTSKSGFDFENERWRGSLD